MVKTIIQYANGLLDALDMFDSIYELTERVAIDGEKIAPGIYCTNGEYNAPDWEQNVLFHMRNGEAKREDLINDLDCGILVKEEQPMALYAIFSKDIIKDDMYVLGKVAQNINNIISGLTDKTIRNQLQLRKWTIQVEEWTTESFDIWDELFSEIEYELPSNYGLIKINYNIVVEGDKECFETYNCDGTDTEIDIVAAIQAKYCVESECPECPTIESLGLFKTGAVTSYNDAGDPDPVVPVQDDGHYEHGYGIDFFTLGPKEGPNSDGLNAFGTNHRFTDEAGNRYIDPYDIGTSTGGFANNYFIDHRTRLGWFDNFFLAGGSLATIIGTIEGSTEGIPGNKSDWFLPNYLQLLSLMRFEPGAHTGWYPFAATGVGVNKVAMSTTAVNGDTVSYYIKFSEGRVFYEVKTTTKNYLKCRFHYDSNWNVL